MDLADRHVLPGDPGGCRGPPFVRVICVICLCCLPVFVWSRSHCMATSVDVLFARFDIRGIESRLLCLFVLLVLYAAMLCTVV